MRTQGVRNRETAVSLRGARLTGSPSSARGARPDPPARSKQRFCRLVVRRESTRASGSPAPRSPAITVWTHNATSYERLIENRVSGGPGRGASHVRGPCSRIESESGYGLSAPAVGFPVPTGIRIPGGDSRTQLDVHSEGPALGPRRATLRTQSRTRLITLELPRFSRPADRFSLDDTVDSRKRLTSTVAHARRSPSTLRATPRTKKTAPSPGARTCSTGRHVRSWARFRTRTSSSSLYDGDDTLDHHRSDSGNERRSCNGNQDQPAVSRVGVTRQRDWWPGRDREQRTHGDPGHAAIFCKALYDLERHAPDRGVPRLLPKSPLAFGSSDPRHRRDTTGLERDLVRVSSTAKLLDSIPQAQPNRSADSWTESLGLDQGASTSRLLQVNPRDLVPMEVPSTLLAAVFEDSLRRLSESIGSGTNLWGRIFSGVASVGRAHRALRVPDCHHGHRGGRSKEPSER